MAQPIMAMRVTSSSTPTEISCWAMTAESIACTVRMMPQNVIGSASTEAWELQKSIRWRLTRLNGILFSGHQDNGTAQQPAEEGAFWDIVSGRLVAEQGADNSADDRTIRL